MSGAEHDPEALADEARRLSDSVARGELRERQLRLAAYLGLPAAVLAVEGRVPARDEPLTDPSSRYGQAVRACSLRATLPYFDELLWLRGLYRWGVEATARAGILWARARVASAPGGAPALVRMFDLVLDDPEAGRAALESRVADTDLAVAIDCHFAAKLTETAGCSSALESIERRRALFHVLDEFVSFWPLGADPRPALALDDICVPMARWALSSECRDRLADDRPMFLPRGSSLRERVMVCETTRTRLQLIDALQRRRGQRATLVFVTGRAREARLDQVLVESLLVDSKILCYLDLVLAVRP
ncbi:MAG: hypothetical protein KC468_17275 [Myxococcales bacterium]|nr:hypothetical protein [Myxococcales bacterium]